VQKRKDPPLELVLLRGRSFELEELMEEVLPWLVVVFGMQAAVPEEVVQLVEEVRLVAQTLALVASLRMAMAVALLVKPKVVKPREEAWYLEVVQMMGEEDQSLRMVVVVGSQRWKGEASY